MPRDDSGTSPAELPTNPEPVRYASVSTAARHIMNTQGESGRLEFKVRERLRTDNPVARTRVAH